MDTQVLPAEVINSLSFSALKLPQSILDTLIEIGYTSPSPIQEQVIPHLMSGSDVIGQAETGTGKTGAFALPILARLQITDAKTNPQVLVLAPTRELALQVSSAFKKYGAGFKGLKVLPMYGGQGYADQLRELKRGVHIVVGTPGRVIDHLSRGTLKLNDLKTIVLDEADEMLRMGFYEEVEKIFSYAPKERQVALFSATMPPQIKNMAKTYLTSPVSVKLNDKLTSSSSVKQSYLIIQDRDKLEAFCRIMETSKVDGVIVFVRTKQAALEVAEGITFRGYKAAPLNGDIPQNQREQTVRRFKANDFDVLVATDVAARGLDIDRVGLVINYDMPYDSESYVHRIGRTGRAGTSGEAILFITPRESRQFRNLERDLQTKIPVFSLPSVKELNKLRVKEFKAKVLETSKQKPQKLEPFQIILEELKEESELSEMEIAVCLAKMLHQEHPLLLDGRHEILVEKLLAPMEGRRGSRDSRGRGSFRDRRDRPSSREYAPREGDRAARGARSERSDRADRGERGAGGERSTERRDRDPRQSDRPSASKPERERAQPKRQAEDTSSSSRSKPRTARTESGAEEKKKFNRKEASSRSGAPSKNTSTGASKKSASPASSKSDSRRKKS